MKDPARPSLSNTASLEHPFAIPWSHGVRDVLSGFKSSEILAPTGPWVRDTPFQTGLPPTHLMFELNGVTASYRDSFSGRARSSTDHLSAGGSIGVGAPFLEAEVSVDYDKTVLENSSVRAHLPWPRTPS